VPLLKINLTLGRSHVGTTSPTLCHCRSATSEQLLDAPSLHTTTPLTAPNHPHQPTPQPLRHTQAQLLHDRQGLCNGLLAAAPYWFLLCWLLQLLLLPRLWRRGMYARQPWPPRGCQHILMGRSASASSPCSSCWRCCCWCCCCCRKRLVRASTCCHALNSWQRVCLECLCHDPGYCLLHRRAANHCRIRWQQHAPRHDQAGQLQPEQLQHGGSHQLRGVTG
jgi:hypothetical protein